ncbi:MAG: universal stress protein [Rhizobiales bacterium]|nr:universal stress protein [Hyphomicrobiales bacterium]MBO6700370.1 universal stress protein [Hyphomicrobiales bacterium]MBO6737466.1 universal stress protein [Hyphomicrobiales bacterium]MBO6913477.1 universal stress protein [Hyphomicrobiales bacterium]MBO6955408.1 universal stress protein [Hyphomicrobiales bacterium]
MADYPVADRPAHASDVIVFAEETLGKTDAIKHAQRISNALGGQLIVAHVMVPPQRAASPIDPVDWDISKQETYAWLASLSRSLDPANGDAKVQLLEGSCIDQIAAHMADRQSHIAAAVRSRGAGRWRLSDTVVGVLESRSAAILVIPEDAPPPEPNGYKTILVPLDGSARAESALPTAVALAKAEAAELLLYYVAPPPGLTEFGMLDRDAAKLSSEVQKRNTLAGQTHLTKVKNSLAPYGLNISTHIITDGDARRALMTAVDREAVDLLVMATHGQSGHSDVPAGDVAGFILGRADVPVLLVRNDGSRSDARAFLGMTSEGVRQPSGTDG